MRPGSAWLALSLLAAPAWAEVAVRVMPTTPGQPAQVEVVARAAPLNEVLDRLARQIGMKVVYDGAQPRQIVTLSLSGRPAAETVLAVLEGQGLNYALLGDASGAGAQTLLVTGSVAPTGAASAPVRTFPGMTRRSGQPPGSSPDAMEADSDDAEEEEDAPFEPPANEVQQPAGAEAAPGAAPQPDAPPGAPVPGQQVPPVQPAGPTTSPFPVSPFAPQPTPYTPQPFPPVAPGAPVGPQNGVEPPGRQQPPQPAPPQEQTPP